MKTKLNKNDIVYFMHWGCLYHGQVTGFDPEEIKGGDRLVYVKTEYGTLNARESHCYTSQQDCLLANANKNHAAAEVYMKEINTVDDLVKFMLEHQVSGEDYDEAAREAAERKAREFNLKI